MTNVIYELRMFSADLSCAPQLSAEGLQCVLRIQGYDEEGQLCKVNLAFTGVLCHKKTSARFSSMVYDAYDRVVEITSSEWLRELEAMNQESFQYWQAKHYAIYLDGVGLYELIAKELAVSDDE